MIRALPEVPETPQGWAIAVMFGLIGMTLFGLRGVMGSQLIEGLAMIVGAALLVFALTDAYLIANTLDELEDSPQIEAIADGGSYEEADA